ncbi:MAG: hypothetical protein M1835_002151, partial [Candelina submexicana]
LKDGGQTLEVAPSGERRCCKETPAWATQFTADSDRNLVGFGQGRKRKRWEAEMETLEDLISSKRRIGGFAPQWVEDGLLRAEQSMERRRERVREERGMLKCDTGLQLQGVTGSKRYLPTVNAKEETSQERQEPSQAPERHSQLYNQLSERRPFPEPQGPKELAAFKRAQRGALKPPEWWYTAVNAFEAAFPDRSIRRFFESHIMRMEQATLYTLHAESRRKSSGSHPPIANKSYRFLLGGPVAKQPVVAKGTL